LSAIQLISSRILKFIFDHGKQLILDNSPPQAVPLADALRILKFIFHYGKQLLLGIYLAASGTCGWCASQAFG
jgi:hypothetical protein